MIHALSVVMDMAKTMTFCFLISVRWYEHNRCIFLIIELALLLLPPPQDIHCMLLYPILLDSQSFLGAQYANLFMTSLQVNDKIHFEPSKYLWSLFSI
jgi:hypothetical protein